MTIKPSAAIRNNYNEDRVVMDIDSFPRREAVSDLREDLLASEEEMMRGAGFTIDETVAAMKRAVSEV